MTQKMGRHRSNGLIGSSYCLQGRAGMFGGRTRLRDYTETSRIYVHGLASPQEFLQDLRETMAQIRPVLATNHTRQHTFVYRELNCSHVFLRDDTVHSSLQPPYSRPHKVIERMSDKIYRLQVTANSEQTKADVTSCSPRCYGKPASTNSKTRCTRRRVPHTVRANNLEAGLEDANNQLSILLISIA